MIFIYVFVTPTAISSVVVVEPLCGRFCGWGPGESAYRPIIFIFFNI